MENQEWNINEKMEDFAYRWIAAVVSNQQYLFYRRIH